MKRLTQDEFIVKAMSIHGDKYDYSKVKYVKAITKVCIICKIHGEFWQIPSNHLIGKGCFLCGNYKRKLNKEEFIEKSLKSHKENVYDYSKVEYVNNLTKVCIICNIHGEFWQIPINHMKGSNCPICSRLINNAKHKITKEEFIMRSNCVHGEGTYNYSKVEYKKAIEKVCIICKIHGEFYQRPNDHSKGYGCSKCALDKCRSSSIEFITKASLIHSGGEYDYTKTKYINSLIKVCISCKLHGDFYQRPQDHLKGHGCPICANIDTAKNLTSTKQDFIDKSIIIHGKNMYDYSKVEYVSSQIKVCIICPIHGDFYQKPGEHLQKHGCNKCNASFGEKFIKKWLITNNIEYQEQYTYKDLKGYNNKKFLKFDFYIPVLKLLIEFDGVQHFRPVQFNGISIEKAKQLFKKTKFLDSLKNKYCLDNNIPLLRISYKDIKRIPEILSENIIKVKIAA
jgi:hypothetical protein